MKKKVVKTSHVFFFQHDKKPCSGDALKAATGGRGFFAIQKPLNLVLEVVYEVKSPKRRNEKKPDIVQRCCSGDALKASTGGYKAKAGRQAANGATATPLPPPGGRSSASNGPKAEEGHTDKQKTKTELK